MATTAVTLEEHRQYSEGYRDARNGVVNVGKAKSSIFYREGQREAKLDMLIGSV